MSTSFRGGRGIMQRHLPGHRAGRAGVAGESLCRTVRRLNRRGPSAGASNVPYAVRSTASRESLGCSLCCSSPASTAVHGGAYTTVTCTGGLRWTYENAGQRTLNPRPACWITRPRSPQALPRRAARCVFHEASAARGTATGPWVRPPRLGSDVGPCHGVTHRRSRGGERRHAVGVGSCQDGA
jgi:hypothetical protein